MNQQQLSRDIADFAFWQHTQNECDRGYVRSGNSVMQKALKKLTEETNMVYSTIVRNPNHPEDKYGFSLAPREAVISAHALFTMRSGNTWEYEQRFGHLVVETPHAFILGDWTALKRESKCL